MVAGQRRRASARAAPGSTCLWPRSRRAARPVRVLSRALRSSHQMTAVPVLLDTDIGSDIDDAIALAYLIAEPRCELRGVTTVSGLPRVRAALADAVCRAGRVTDVPIHAGAEHAIVGHTPQPDVPQAAVLDRFDHRPADDFEASTAVAFLRDTILAAPGELTLLTIGPLTNAGLPF